MRLVQFIARRTDPVAMTVQRKLGEILVEARAIDELQLRSALGEQQRWGGRLGVTLIKLGFVGEMELTRALSSQLGIPMASLEGKRVQPAVLERIPAQLAERHMALPLFIRQENGFEVLYVGMEDPCDLAAIDELSFCAGIAIRPVLLGPSELCEGIDRFYHRPALKPVAAPEPQLQPVLASQNPPPQPVLESPEKPQKRVSASPEFVVRALTELLIETGVVDRDELMARLQEAADAV